MCLRLLLHRFPSLSTKFESEFGSSRNGNQIQFGSLLFKLTGPAQYLGKKKSIGVWLYYMQLSVFDRAVYSGEFRGGKEGNEFLRSTHCQTPFFAFFLVTEDFIAARGRGGGLALWVKETWTLHLSAEYSISSYSSYKRYYACWQDTGLSESMDLTLLWPSKNCPNKFCSAPKCLDSVAITELKGDRLRASRYYYC